MISYATELEDRVKRLIEDVGPLGTISLLGFVESDRRKADQAIQKLAADRSWRFLDLRAASIEDTTRVLGEYVSEKLLVVATRNDHVQRPILNLVHALIDKEPNVELGDFIERTRPKKQSVVLIVDGASAHASLPNELRRIPYEEYLP